MRFGAFIQMTNILTDLCVARPEIMIASSLLATSNDVSIAWSYPDLLVKKRWPSWSSPYNSRVVELYGTKRKQVYFSYKLMVASISTFASGSACQWPKQNIGASR